MYNYKYLSDLRKEGLEITPPTLMIYLFQNELDDKDVGWLIFEEEIIIQKNELDMPYEQNLRNILMIANKNMSEQILSILYYQDYDPFIDEINLNWFNSSQQQYLKKCMNTLKEIEKSKENILIGLSNDLPFVLSEFHSKDINIKDLFFEEGIDVLFTFEKNDPTVKIYFNNKLYLWEIEKLIQKIEKKYTINYIQESLSIEITDKKLTSIDIFNILNDIDIETIASPIFNSKKEFKIKLKKEKKNEE